MGDELLILTGEVVDGLGGKVLVGGELGAEGVGGGL